MANTTPQAAPAQHDEVGVALLASLNEAKNGFMGLTSSMKGFVEALSPASVGLFNQALYDLSAVIGSALQPVFDAATTVVRAFADALVPIMEKLRPVMEELAGLVLDALLPAIDAFASMIEAMLPILRPLMDVVKAVSIALQTMVTIIGALVSSIMDAIGSFAGGDGVKSWSEQLVDTVKLLAKNLILLVGATAKWLGALGFLDRLIKGFDKGAEGRKKGSSVGAGAPTDSQITDLRGYANRIMQNAFTATGGQTEKKTEDWLEEVVAELKRMQKGESSWFDALKDTLHKWWKELPHNAAMFTGRGVMRLLTLDFGSSDEDFDRGWQRWFGG